MLFVASARSRQRSARTPVAVLAAVLLCVVLACAGAQALEPARAQARAPAGTRSFSPLVRTVMVRLARSRLTAVALRAPSDPLARLSVQTARGLGGWFQAQRSFYLVHIGLCSDLHPPPAVHRAVAPRRRCGGAIADLVSGFSYGARRYRNRAAALAALRLPPVRGRPSRVALGYGVIARGYHRGGGLIAWRQGSWSLRVNYSACLADAIGGDTFTHLTLPTARSIVAFVHHHPLPRDPGRALFSGSCGDTSSASDQADWALGRDVERTMTAGYDPLFALRLAEAMRPFPRRPAS